MKKFFFIEIVVYILEVVFTLYFCPMHFIPLFGYFYVLRVARQIALDKNRLLFCTISGLIYDLFITTTPFMNTVLFPILMLFLQKIDGYLLKNKLTFFFLFLFEVFLYRSVTYLILMLIQYHPFLLERYINSMLYSLGVNIIFVIICQFLLERRQKTYFKK